jgi:hypothetical protein
MAHSIKAPGDMSSEEPRYRNGSSFVDSPGPFNSTGNSDTLYAPRLDYYTSDLDEDDAAFWCLSNCQNWSGAPSVIDHDQKNKDREARDAASMADPFEVRMRFSAQLQHLNASVVSAQKAAQYALKYKDMSEDLHSCILEQLERVSGLPSFVICFPIFAFLGRCAKHMVAGCVGFLIALAE